MRSMQAEGQYPGYLSVTTPILTDLGQRFLPCPCFGLSTLAVLICRLWPNQTPYHSEHS